ncbi:MAG: ISKra4 family transposase, partial [Richelia sp.]|nr:ISKra4 family transposase [Richelia sp.]
MRGAEPVLPLGSLYISGDWDEYWQFHLQQEHKPNHLALYSSGIIPLMKQVFKARCYTTPPPLPIPV